MYVYVNVYVYVYVYTHRHIASAVHERMNRSGELPKRKQTDKAGMDAKYVLYKLLPCCAREVIGARKVM